MTAVYNAANEEAAEAFLAGRIGFPAIVRTIADVLHAADQWAAEPATVDDVLDAQRWARERAQRAVAQHRPPGCRQKPPEWCEKGLAAEMMFVIGIVLFALAILISVALHECGHMWVARAHRHEGAPLLRRLRPDAVVDPAAAKPSTASRRSRSAASATSPA